MQGKRCVLNNYKNLAPTENYFSQRFQAVKFEPNNASVHIVEVNVKYLYG